MRKALSLVAVALATAGAMVVAGPANPILFVTQVPIPGDFTTIGSTFGNHLPTLEACGRGGDLYIRYPDGSVKNLTRAAGYGRWGVQDTNGIAVRQPCVHWSGTKAVFSMVVGAPKKQFDYGSNPVWQLYEITNFTDPHATPLITKVPNQPAAFNNVSPAYGTDDRLLFTSDRPRSGESQLYPQLDEYEEAPTVSGIWSLDPATGDLFLVNHNPSGAFSPHIDSAGRIVFSRWDHLQRDQQLDTDVIEGQNLYGPFNYSDESPQSYATTNVDEVYPEPRSVRTDLLAGTPLIGNDFNQFFPWAINQDGTTEETVNHIGRHEIGGSYARASFNNDPNLQDLYYYGANYNTNTIDNFLNITEDPRVAGLFLGIDAPEFGTHGGGQIVSLTGATNVNAFYMKVAYLTPRSTHDAVNPPGPAPADHTGFYRNPLVTTDGYTIAAHTAYVFPEPGGSDASHPSTPYNYRLKLLTLQNGYYAPDTELTAGLTNAATYWSPDIRVTNTNLLWELDPVEVLARARPGAYATPIPGPELAAFAEAGVDAAQFQDYLRTHNLALMVSRDVTTRDHADHLQPFNLRVAGTSHKTTGASGKVYDVGWLQLFQADQLRSLNFGNTNNPRPGRRVLARYLHEPAVDNPYAEGAPAGAVPVAPDGSTAAFIPAQRAMTWQLTDTNGAGVVRERYWVSFAPGEVRSCTSCHGINVKDQADLPAPTNTPTALVQLLQYWKRETAITASLVTVAGTVYPSLSFSHRPAETAVTSHVQESADLVHWTEIASYSGGTSKLSPQAMELSRSGSPSETVTLRETAALDPTARRFLRVTTTRP